MHDFVAPLRRGLISHRRAGILKYCLDLAAQNFLIKLERGFALAIEHQVWVQLHRNAPAFGLMVPACYRFAASCCSSWRAASIASLGPKSSNSKSCRISISPSAPSPWGAGARMAHSIASSLDLTWISQYPAIS